MKTHVTLWIAVAALSALLGFVGSAAAQAESGTGRELSLMGGFQMLNENDTAVPDRLVNLPLVATATYPLTRNWALEGDVAWMIPVNQSIDVGMATKQDRKPPDLLSYQASVRASLPLAGWTPYLVGGAGAVTFLSNTDADRVPNLAESQTVFAINFGAGATYALADHWALRADFRELAAFPSNDAQGLSIGGNADAIWMERTIAGVAYRF